MAVRTTNMGVLLLSAAATGVMPVVSLSMIGPGKRHEAPWKLPRYIREHHLGTTADQEADYELLQEIDRLNRASNVDKDKESNVTTSTEKMNEALSSKDTVVVGAESSLPPAKRTRRAAHVPRPIETELRASEDPDNRHRAGDYSWKGFSPAGSEADAEEPASEEKKTASEPEENPSKLRRFEDDEAVTVLPFHVNWDVNWGEDEEEPTVAAPGLVSGLLGRLSSLFRSRPSDTGNTTVAPSLQEETFAADLDDDSDSDDGDDFEDFEELFGRSATHAETSEGVTGLQNRWRPAPIEIPQSPSDSESAESEDEELDWDTVAAVEPWSPTALSRQTADRYSYAQIQNRNPGFMRNAD
jgi:hypothetical protein